MLARRVFLAREKRAASRTSFALQYEHPCIRIGNLIFTRTKLSLAFSKKTTSRFPFMNSNLL